MKKWIFLLVLCLTGLSFATPIHDRSLNPAALSDLACTLGIPAGSDLLAETQKRWLRSAGLERWEMQELTEEQRQFVLAWGKEQEIFSEWKPSETSYDSALILGATTGCMQQRLDYLKRMWEEGVSFHEIVWLTGDRPLDKKIDKLTERCNTESEAARILWEEADLPPAMRELPVHFIATPMIVEEERLRRPTTADTIFDWLATNPAPCRALFISDQPFCGYQFAIINAILPDTIPFELVGIGVDPSGHPAAAAITLDAIARWLYAECNSK